MSYLQIKRLVDEHIKQLNTPIVVDDEMRRFSQKHQFSEKKLASILLKCNLAIKRHNRSVYNKQVVHQIVQQILKSEQDKVNEVNSQVSRLYQMMQPITANGINAEALGTIDAISRLAAELPESRHLFAFSDMDLADDLARPGSASVDSGVSDSVKGRTDGVNDYGLRGGAGDSRDAAQHLRDVKDSSIIEGPDDRRNLGGIAEPEVPKDLGPIEEPEVPEGQGPIEVPEGRVPIEEPRLLNPNESSLERNIPKQSKNLGHLKETDDSVMDENGVLDEDRREVAREVQLKISQNQKTRTQLREQYESLRQQLLALNEDILYHQEKRLYIDALAQKLKLDLRISGADLEARMSRFGILVEKLLFQHAEQARQ